MSQRKVFIEPKHGATLLCEEISHDTRDRGPAEMDHDLSTKAAPPRVAEQQIRLAHEIDRRRAAKIAWRVGKYRIS
jgi:hypothetical protein